MSFAAPGAFVLLALLPLLAVAFVLLRRRRRAYVVRFPATPVVASVLPRRPNWRRWVAPALLAASAVALTVALARPQATVAVPVERASVMLIFDASGSMRAEDVAPTRLQAAQSAAHRFLDRVPDSLLVGFVSYSNAPMTVVQPTVDRVPVRSALAGLRADGGTATGDALVSALDLLEARRTDDGRVAPAAVVLLSDGKTTAGSDPVEASRRAGALGVPVYTVALGTPDGVIHNGPYGGFLPVPPDPQTLRAMSERSGGNSFRVDDAGELDRVYERLGSRIGTRDQRREVSAAFAGGGLLLLLAGLGSALRWRPRLL
ncbi:MAG: von Willebrand factor, type A [uncultured Solirubrobacteraceae bacterium]|uniref:von Willebrand factor, type A n=1 Tax=uncultured Solirubrobacteraceae bacterium TaxID=1162706 RepID=A0A6J4R2W9_9ACTN|nr:MAG: von Willebrand factor, type A [uncultured Solirubrobacteraceae bacterium]